MRRPMPHVKIRKELKATRMTGFAARVILVCGIRQMIVIFFDVGVVSKVIKNAQFALDEVVR